MWSSLFLPREDGISHSSRRLHLKSDCLSLQTILFPSSSAHHLPNPNPLHCWYTFDISFLVIRQWPSPWTHQLQLHWCWAWSFCVLCTSSDTLGFFSSQSNTDFYYNVRNGPLMIQGNVLILKISDSLGSWLQSERLRDKSLKLFMAFFCLCYWDCTRHYRFSSGKTSGLRNCI